MATQTDYNLHPAIGMPGQIAHPTQFQDIVSGIVETAAGIAPGLGVVQGTAEDQAEIEDGASNILGVSVLRVARESVDYAQNESMGIMRKGRIYVEVEDAVTKGGAAFVRHTAPGAQVIGAFRSDGDTGNARAFPGIFASSAGAGEMAILEVDVTALS